MEKECKPYLGPMTSQRGDHHLFNPIQKPRAVIVPLVCMERGARRGGTRAKKRTVYIKRIEDRAGANSGIHNAKHKTESRSTGE
jgi:hypothetical protein